MMAEKHIWQLWRWAKPALKFTGDEPPSTDWEKELAAAAGVSWEDVLEADLQADLLRVKKEQEKNRPLTVTFRMDGEPDTVLEVKKTDNVLMCIGANLDLRPKQLLYGSTEVYMGSFADNEIKASTPSLLIYVTFIIYA